MTDEPELLIDDAEGVRTLTLNRPDRLNALTIPLRLAIQAAVEEFDEDDDLKALLITGAGRGFCAGSDLGGGRSRRSRSGCATTRASALAGTSPSTARASRRSQRSTGSQPAVG